jgi:hypothetical protein
VRVSLVDRIPTSYVEPQSDTGNLIRLKSLSLIWTRLLPSGSIYIRCKSSRWFIIKPHDNHQASIKLSNNGQSKSKSKGKGAKTAHGKLNKREKNIKRADRRRAKHWKSLGKEHIYVPPQLAANEIEVHDPTLPFTLAPCQLCGVGECGDRSIGHELPVTVGTCGVGTLPSACGIFCNVSSAFNETFMLHGNLTRREIGSHTAIAAAEQVHALCRTKKYKQAKIITTIIIKTNSKWFGYKFAGREDSSMDKRYSVLTEAFDNALDALTECSGVRLMVKFWKVNRFTAAVQLATSTLQGWKEATARMEAHD